MKPEAQRIALAEWAGWCRRSIDYGDYDSTYNVMMWCCDGMSPQHQLPDYLNDLNAVHELEKRLPHTVYSKYVHLLICGAIEDANGYQGTPLTLGSVLNSHCTSAAQRCEALLRTIGKWEDGKEGA